MCHSFICDSVPHPVLETDEEKLYLNLSSSYSANVNLSIIFHISLV